MRQPTIRTDARDGRTVACRTGGPGVTLDVTRDTSPVVTLGHAVTEVPMLPEGDKVEEVEEPPNPSS